MKEDQIARPKTQETPVKYGHEPVPRPPQGAGRDGVPFPETWLDKAGFGIFKVELVSDAGDKRQRCLIHWTSDGNGTGILELNFDHPFRPGLGTEALGKRGARKILNALINESRVLN
jgi:hypothetical protein